VRAGVKKLLREKEAMRDQTAPSPALRRADGLVSPTLETLMQPPRTSRLGAFPFALVAGILASAQLPAQTPAADELLAKPAAVVLLPETVVTALREPVETDRSPSAVTVIGGAEAEKKQLRFVTDALRTVPGLSVVQTGMPGQQTTAFTRGLTGEATQVMLNGLPMNQSFSGAFNFADLTMDNLERIEVVRGPQSALFGPRAGGGVINLIPKRGTKNTETTATFEAGSFGTFRESASTSGQAGMLDYSVGATRLDTDGFRPNSAYRASSGLLNLGITPREGLRIFTIGSNALYDASTPGPQLAPTPFDNLLTERWMIAPGIEFEPVDRWKHRLLTDYDEERQVFNPSIYGTIRGSFKRYQLDYQNELLIGDRIKLTTGLYYSRVESTLLQYPVAPSPMLPPTLLSDRIENYSGFGQLQVEPLKDLLLVAGGRYDHFTQFGDITTHRFAASYKLPGSGSVLRASSATGFAPATAQDKLYGKNLALEPNKTSGSDIGFEQPLWNDRLRFGANYFQNKLSNVVGYDQATFIAFNGGSAETRGAEFFLSAEPVKHLTLSAAYTYLDTEDTSAHTAQRGPRLLRRPRNELYGSIDYLWFDRLRTGLDVKYVNAREDTDAIDYSRVDAEDYTTVRLWAEYQITDHLKLFGRIENLGDQRYCEVSGFPNPGRAFYGGFTLRF